jgi:hypothetical protein
VQRFVSTGCQAQKRMRTLSFFLLLLCSIACSKNKRCDSNIYNYTFSNNAKVDTIFNSNSQRLRAEKGSGNKLVFIYNHTYTSCPGIADADFSRTLLFEADPAANSFNYTVNDFQTAMVYSYADCFCAGSGATLPQSGTITGTKISNSRWKIDADLVVEFGISVKLSGTFLLR